MIQGIVGTRFVFWQRLKSSQQNGLLRNKSGNSEKLERLGLKELLIEKLVDQRSIKA